VTPFTAVIHPPDQEEDQDKVRVTVYCWLDPDDPYVAGLLHMPEEDAETFVGVVQAQVGPVIGQSEVLALPGHLA
jgi:hypothetical protein